MISNYDLLKCRRCVCGNLRRSTRAITRFYDHCLHASELRITQFSLLLNISLHENIMVTELAEILIMDQTTVTRNLEILYKKGYIQITKGRDDNRKKIISLTTKGQDKLLETIPLWKKAQTAIVNQVGADEFNHFLFTLSKIADLAK